MTQAHITLNHAAGLHARPAALFVKLASKFHSTITVQCGAKTANAKSIVQVLTLGANEGSTVVINAEGDDEHIAVDALVDLVNRNFITE